VASMSVNHTQKHISVTSSSDKPHILEYFLTQDTHVVDGVLQVKDAILQRVTDVVFRIAG